MHSKLEFQRTKKEMPDERINVGKYTHFHEESLRESPNISPTLHPTPPPNMGPKIQAQKDSRNRAAAIPHPII